MNRTALITLLSILVLLLCAGAVTYYFYSTPNDASDSDAVHTLSSTETQSFFDLDGNEITFQQHEGTIRVVNSWASWSPFSVDELKLLDKIAGEYKDQSVTVIAINRKEPNERAKSFLGTIQEFNNIIFALDPNDTFFAAVGGFSMPETLFYDARGTIVFHKRGVLTEEELRTNIEKMLEKKQ